MQEKQQQQQIFYIKVDLFFAQIFLRIIFFVGVVASEQIPKILSSQEIELYYAFGSKFQFQCVS